MKEFLTGNEAVVKATLAAGAEVMTGYPITPTTEIIHYWSEEASKNKKLKFLQTEDEMAAGFAMIGAVLAGKIAFTATAGPGNVLMQDAFSMAESMRLPTVAFINQRGGPSTGTVIYSQQELNLTCFGGNGEGLRIVYSASSPQEMYNLSLKAFQTAWKYRFPTFVLSDGYTAKTMVEIETGKSVNIKSEPYLLSGKREATNLRNCYNLETELNELIVKNKEDFEKNSQEIIEAEEFETQGAEIVIFAHGVVGASAFDAVRELRKNGVKVGLFRPITLNPFPAEKARYIANQVKTIITAESALGQFERLLKANIYGQETKIKSLSKPALGISSEEIIDFVKENK